VSLWLSLARTRRCRREGGREGRLKEKSEGGFLYIGRRETKRRRGGGEEGEAVRHHHRPTLVKCFFHSFSSTFPPLKRDLPSLPPSLPSFLDLTRLRKGGRDEKKSACVPIIRLYRSP